MGSTRIKGIGLLLTLGTPAVDYFADCTSVTLNNEEADSDVTTFEDAAQPGGARQFLLDIVAIQSTDPTSLWTHIWDHSGDDVPFVYAPHGNATPTENQPHFTGMLTIGPPPSIGGEAGRDTTWTYETQWRVIGRPVKITS